MIIRSFGNKEFVFHLPKNCPVYIEISNTWDNKIEKNLSIIRLFKNKVVLDMKNVEEINVPTDLNSSM